ncbi:MAG TPA: methylated-DNA--[protein]-cysteine S-methyltransferase [Xanthobacteraceae bacterium]|nr:methylated-DNA--[protein]-cysteine S-methyltransferase [Xanthobacteraceae bacterium]
MNDVLQFALFDTPIGRCGIVWSARGIAGVELAQKSAQATRSRLLRRFGTASEAEPPPEVQRAIDSIVGLLRGEPMELSDVTLDNGGLPEFNRRVYDVARSIRPGATLSYGEIAERLGDRTLARDVAQALSENPFPIIVPCHRVLAAGGKMGGFSGPGGVRTKLRLLSIEGAQYGEPMLFDRLPWAAAARRPT